MTDQRPLLPVTQSLPTDKYGETAIDRIRDHAENGTMPPQFREDLRTLLRLTAEQDGWQPIESAPEGNEDDGPFFDVAWIGETHRYLPVLRRAVDCYRQRGSIKRQHSFPAMTTVFLRKPTHWKATPALPTPPAPPT